MNYENIICIHLKRFKTVEQFEKLLNDHEITRFSAEYFHELMEDGYTKVYLDQTTHQFIALCHGDNKKVFQITEDFIDHLKKLPSITFKSKKNKLNLDQILDKISSKGIDSLTLQEKEYLKNIN
jgi:hypothetical protein